MRKVAEVYLLAENRLLREALVRLLNKKGEVRVVGTNGYSHTIHEEIISLQPSIILMDSGGLGSPNATLMSTLHVALRETKVIMVDMEPDERAFLRSVRAGVVGYLLKDASAEEVTATIRAVVAGQAVCPLSLTMALFRSVAQPDSMLSVVSWGVELGLSRREQHMVELLRQRLTNKAIAARLNLSEQTVKNHVHNILRKLGAPNRSSIVERCETSSGLASFPEQEHAS